MDAKEARSGTEIAFRDYRNPLINLALFKYISPLLMAMDDEFPEVVVNLKKYRRE